MAKAIQAHAPEAAITFLGTPRGLEGRLIPEAGFPLEMVDMVPFAGRSRAVFPAALTKASIQANRILRRVGAHVAVSMGGYPGIPAISGAWLGRLPSLIHESGAIPGKANLLAARLTANVAVAFESAAPAFRGRRVRVVGMPLDSEVTGLNRQEARAKARAGLGVAEDTFVVFVTGGSQGAASLNSAAVGLGRRWAQDSSVCIILKTGRAHHDAMAAEIATAGAGAVVRPVSFFEHITDAYAAADLTISRAGAGTVTELAAVGMPSILVPYPHAADDHQTVNARSLADVGGAMLVADVDATADNLGPMIEALRLEPKRLQALGERARQAARPDAATELAQWVLDLAQVER